MLITNDSFGDAWLALLRLLHDCGASSSPRGQAVRELLGVTIRVDDARRNILVHDDRALSYRFAAAEWLWIWFGRNDVESIAQYNKNIAAFSDDGLTFSGAYGPHIHGQWPRVIETLRDDRASRQAVIQIYHPPLTYTRDVPCTLTFQMLIRQDVLHGIVTMRSSDVWLGLPYDFFSFSMFCNIAAAQLDVALGSLTYHLGSSHLYDRDLVVAKKVLVTPWKCYTVPSPLLMGEPPAWLEDVLRSRVRLGVNDRTWARYVNVLCASKNAGALEVLRKTD